MSEFSWTLPEGEASGGGGKQPATDFDRLWGRDLWFDLAEGKRANLLVTPAGDWKVASGREALRQAIVRRLVTNPGEWATVPDYGAGVRLYAKARLTGAVIDELRARIRAQLAREPRVTRVGEVSITPRSDGAGIRVAVSVVARGRLAEGGPLVAVVEVS